MTSIQFNPTTSIVSYNLEAMSKLNTLTNATRSHWLTQSAQNSWLTTWTAHLLWLQGPFDPRNREHRSISDIVDTTIPGDEHRLEDLNPSTINNHYGRDKTHDLDQPILLKTVEEPEDPIEEPKVLQDTFQVHQPNEQVLELDIQ